MNVEILAARQHMSGDRQRVVWLTAEFEFLECWLMVPADLIIQLHFIGERIEDAARRRARMFQQRCLHPFSSGGFPPQSIEAASSIRYRQCQPSSIL
ncbi:hypothetical protein ATB53_00955 [Xanthomonas translucens]|uniref:Uncharacterized protein n=1 Tax=Xanthomonas campestris pv. translucens TaxID=343 RepID=A0A109HKD8_XANCT|nr:hypothetical protein OZ12_18025 [Xanthomonas translucens pv. translucens]KWV11483.1 hypothetical protein ATB54_00755 [Xanthomonas translucens]KWV13800.1 hypothetical protein ATB53_00955 [Xanthomonas translucens]OAX60327.1 hypothetical protein A6R79_11105 [Xanthomonas translucens pv. translucens]